MEPVQQNEHKNEEQSSPFGFVSIVQFFIPIAIGMPVELTKYVNCDFFLSAVAVAVLKLERLFSFREFSELHAI